MPGKQEVRKIGAVGTAASRKLTAAESRTAFSAQRQFPTVYCPLSLSKMSTDRKSEVLFEIHWCVELPRAIEFLRDFFGIESIQRADLDGKIGS